MMVDSAWEVKNLMVRSIIIDKDVAYRKLETDIHYRQKRKMIQVNKNLQTL